MRRHVYKWLRGELVTHVHAAADLGKDPLSAADLKGLLRDQYRIKTVDRADYEDLIGAVLFQQQVRRGELEYLVDPHPLPGETCA